jgi:hypothetical protein
MRRINTKNVLLKIMLFLIPFLVIFSSAREILREDDVKGVENTRNVIKDYYSPTITNLMPNLAYPGEEYIFVPRIISRDYDSVYVEIVESPRWMFIDYSGIVRGVPTDMDKGTHRVEIRVVDSIGSSTISEYIIVTER